MISYFVCVSGNHPPRKQKHVFFFHYLAELLVQSKYEIEVELNLTDAETVKFIRSLLNNGSFFTLNPTVNVTQIDLTTGWNSLLKVQINQILERIY